MRTPPLARPSRAALAALLAAVVLAAGAATRFGGPKQLAMLDGRPLVRHALAAVAAVPQIAPAVVVLGDMPRIDAALLGRLAAAYRAAQPRPGAVVPVHGGRRGNPVLLDLAILASELEALTGDAGAGRSLARRDDVIEIEGGPGCLLDIDTLAAFDPSISVSRDLVDDTVATVLGVSAIFLLVPASVGFLLLMLVIAAVLG